MPTTFRTKGTVEKFLAATRTDLKPGTWLNPDAGMNPIVLAQIVGHSSLRMIEQVYSHLNTSDTYEAMMRTIVDERRTRTGR